MDVDGGPLRRPDGRQPMFASDGIALSNDDNTLYYQALTGRTLYAIATERLTPGASPEEVEGAVRKLGTTHVADGMWMSSRDMLFITSPCDNSVKRWDGSSSEIAVQDDRLRWPDTLSEGPDGTIYVTASRIQDTYWFKPGRRRPCPPDYSSSAPRKGLSMGRRDKKLVHVASC